ncbi:MAG: type II toxin-antitoxin system ParD family antitoxin [Spirochaetaceae bacterium]|nr:type II toxin-antitoxin system ParD family antitoxin [Spirochaetaceae bacterium]
MTKLSAVIRTSFRILKDRRTRLKAVQKQLSRCLLSGMQSSAA